MDDFIIKNASFQGNPYPYGSEYSYDNTGEEAVYTAAKASGDTSIMSKVDAGNSSGSERLRFSAARPDRIAAAPTL